MQLSSSKKIIIYLSGILTLGCSANSQEGKKINTSSQAANIINELKGCWHPILYTTSDVYALDTNEISKYMQQNICFGMDTAIIFSDTIFSIKVENIEILKKEDWIFQNIDAGKRKAYNILAPEIRDITLDCEMRSEQQEKATFSDTRELAYDGKYLYYGADGFNFLLVKDSLM